MRMAELVSANLLHRVSTPLAPPGQQQHGARLKKVGQKKGQFLSRQNSIISEMAPAHGGVAAPAWTEHTGKRYGPFTFVLVGFYLESSGKLSIFMDFLLTLLIKIIIGSQMSGIRCHIFCVRKHSCVLYVIMPLCVCPACLGFLPPIPTKGGLGRGERAKASEAT
jgi:hypothetical protein